MSQVSHSLATVLGSDWKLHCAYRPQNSGQVEHMNRTLKETRTKLALEIGADRNSPYQMGLIPFEIMFGTPLPIVPSLQTELLAELDDRESSGYINMYGQSLGPFLSLVFPPNPRGLGLR